MRSRAALQRRADKWKLKVGDAAAALAHVQRRERLVAEREYKVKRLAEVAPVVNEELLNIEVAGPCGDE